MMAAQSGFKEQYGSLDSLDVSVDIPQFVQLSWYFAESILV